MQVTTTRFGTLEISADDVLEFPSGLIGFEDCRQWVLLADAQNEALGWLQCISRPDVAMPVVSPRRFVENYQFRVFRSELAPLGLADVQDAHVLAIVGKRDRGLTLNLKAPVVLNLARRMGRQVVANGEAPLQYDLTPEYAPLKMSA